LAVEVKKVVLHSGVFPDFLSTIILTHVFILPQIRTVEIAHRCSFH